MNAKKIYLIKIYLIKICVFITILSAFTYVFNKIGYFPIIGSIIADKKLSAYSSKVNTSNQNVETSYDWYNCKYESINSNNNILSYRLQSNSIYDESVANDVTLSAEKQYSIIKESFSKTLNFPSKISVLTELNGDDYSIKSQRLYLTGIYNIENISPEDSKKTPATIAQEFINLMGEDYNFTGIQLIYYDKNGGYTIEIPSNTFKKLDYEHMLEKTIKMQQEELSEEYFDWLLKQ